MYKIVEIAKTFVVRRSSALTRHQPYVYCREQHVADAVASCFNNGTRSIKQYRWQCGAPNKNEPHWCVTPDIQWVLAGVSEVRPGQFYIGVWSYEKTAHDSWEAIVMGDDKVDDYTSGIGPIRGHGFVIVNAHDHANLADKRATPAQPTILPCISPMDDFDRLSHEMVEGLTGLECLARFEAALKTESFSRDNGKLYVPVPEGVTDAVGGVNGGLVEAQIVFAKQVWSAKLRRLVAEKRAAETQAAHDRVVCDDVDELPNMRYIDA